MTIHTPEAPPSPRLANSLVRITTDQYHKMIEQGIIPEDSSTELLDGLIVIKDRGDLGGDDMGHSALHVLAVSLLSDLASRINGPLRHLKVQLPIDIAPYDAPEPDAAIIRGTARDHAGRIPKASDVYCVMEAAHSSLERDTEDKLSKFAKAGIPQYVIINLRENQVEIYSHPDMAAERYKTRSIAGKTDRLALNLGHGETLEVQAADLLP